MRLFGKQNVIFTARFLCTATSTLLVAAALSTSSAVMFAAEGAAGKDRDVPRQRSSINSGSGSTPRPPAEFKSIVPVSTVRTTARPVLFGRGMFTTSRPPRAVHRRRGISLAFHRTDGRAGSARPADPSTAIATSSTHSSRTLSSDLLDRRETRARPGRRVRPVRSGRRVQPDPTDRRVMASRFAARGTRTRPIARTTS